MQTNYGDWITIFFEVGLGQLSQWNIIGSAEVVTLSLDERLPNKVVSCIGVS